MTQDTSAATGLIQRDSTGTGRLFMNVTFLMAWTGRPVGIWRVEAEIHALVAHSQTQHPCKPM